VGETFCILFYYYSNMSSFTLHLRDHPLKKQKIQTQQALSKIKHRSYIKDLLVSNILKKYADRV